MPDDDSALLAIEGPIATITLNRPHVFNAINLAMAMRLEELAQQVEASTEARVLVIQGAGSSFCAGGDLRTFAADIDNVGSAVRTMLRHYNAFIASLRRMPKLVLTSVHGSAAGGGLSLAFMGDFCLAADDAQFIPAYAKLGLSPDAGGTVGLVHAAGVRRALQIFLAEDSFSAQQAYQWELINKVVKAPDLCRETLEFARRLARNASDAIAQTKKLIYRNAPAVEAQLEAETKAIMDCMNTARFRSTVEKFVGEDNIGTSRH